jgi:hypothetical protein
VRQALAAIIRMRGQPDPAAFAELVIGLLEALGRAHDAVLKMAAFGVAGEVERLDFVLAKLPGLLHHGFQKIGRRLGQAQSSEGVADLEHVVEDETEIIDRCGIGGHDLLCPWRA